MNYSIIVPVFNRPDEVGELLESLAQQTFKDFEVIIVEDGSQRTCKDVCDQFAGILPLHYYYKENSGPGQSRNYGAERANGEWLIVLDSDVVLPPDYLRNSVKRGSEGSRVCTPAPSGAAARCCPPFFHPCPESHQLLYDLFLHHWRHPRWSRQEARQVLSPFI